MAVDFDNVFTGKGVWTTHKGNQNLIQYGFPVGGNNVAMIKDVAFPQTLFFAGLKNPARDFLRLRSADADNPPGPKGVAIAAMVSWRSTTSQFPSMS